MNSSLGVIGGSGLTQLGGLKIARREKLSTAYGDPSSDLSFGKFQGIDLVFLARHGDDHSIPPHKINYRANIWALKTAGVKAIVAVAAVGGIRSDMAPGKVAIPDQLIDYTYGRPHTYFEGGGSGVVCYWRNLAGIYACNKQHG